MATQTAQPSNLNYDTLISVASLLNKPVSHKDDQEVGKLVDLVFRWNTGQPYPPLVGVLVRVGRRTAWISAGDLTQVTAKHVRLRTARLDLRDFKQRDGEVRLVQEILDHQLVDVNGARVVRASDLYIASIADQVHLVGVDVGYRPLIRRLAPGAMRSKPNSKSVIDWAAIQSFGAGESATGRGLRLAATREELHGLRPSELADLIEDLGRSERQELLEALEPGEVADAFEEMQPHELEGVLRESDPDQAAEYLANMEPDEAADALRDIDPGLRRDLLALMPNVSSDQVEAVLSYEENSAGGFMTTAIVTARPTETVAALRTRLRLDAENLRELDAVVLTTPKGKLVNDLPLIDILLAHSETRLVELTGPTEPITVPPDASVEKVAELLIANRRSSVLVVNDKNKPLGRILADDVVDALLQNRRFRIPGVRS